MRRRVRQFALLLLVTIVLAGASLLILVQTSIFQAWLLRHLETVTQSAGYRFTAERLSLDIWKLQVTLEGVSYDDGRGVRAALDRVFLDIPWNGFSGDVIKITGLEADGVSLDLGPATEAGGQPTGTFKAPAIVFDSLAIRNGSLTYSDPATTVRIPSFNLETRNGRGALRVASPISLSPEVRLFLPQVELQVAGRFVDFGPADWRLEHPDLTLSGSGRGHVQWAPSFLLSFDYSTNPFSYRRWQDVSSSASIKYENTVMSVTDFRARSGSGMATATAEITAQSNSVDLHWEEISLAPEGFPGVTNGNVRLQWKASDWSDLSGSGSILINSRQYGRAQSAVAIRNGTVNLNVTAAALDAAVRANITANLDRAISGTFLATHRKYGNVRLNGSIGGTLSDPRADAALRADQVVLNGIGPISGSANASLRSRVLSLDNIQVQFKNSRAQNGSLRLHLDRESLSGEISDIQARLDDLYPEMSGSATLSASITGTIRQPAASIAGSSEGLDLAGIHIDHSELTGRLTGEEFDLTRLTARQGEGTLSASGKYEWTTGLIAASADVHDAHIVQIPDLSATASFSADIAGTLDSPEVNFDGQFRHVVYRSEEHGDLDLRGTIEDGFASIKMQSPKYSAGGSADIRLEEPYAYTASLTADQSRIAHKRYEAAVNGTVRASGELKPFRLERISFDKFTARGEGAELELSGSFPEGAALNASANLAELPVDAVDLAGEARVKAVVSGSLSDPRIDGSLETANATVRASGMDEAATIQGAIDFTRNEFAIRNLRAVFAGASADIGGRGTLDGTGQFTFRAEGVRPERLLKDRPVAGLLDLEGEVDIAGLDVERISGSARVTHLELDLNGVAVRQVRPVEIDLKDEVLTAREFSLEGLNTRTDITGSVNVRTRALDLKIDSNTDLKVLEAFLPGSKPLGQARTSVTVRGTPDQPDLDGFLNVTGLQLQIPEPPVLITNGNAELRLRRDRIQIASASGTINDGEFTALGGTSLSSDGLGQTAIQLRLTRAQTEYPEGFQSEISSRLFLIGTGTDLQITGNVDVLSGIYLRNMNLTQEVISRIAADAAPAAADGLDGESALDRIRVNVAVGTPGVVSVANNLARFDMEGAFRLRGTIGNPIINGRARIAEGGELYFGPRIGTSTSPDAERSDRYVISEGTIDFNNPIRTEPAFSISATREVQTPETNYVITLRATGTPANFKAQLSADPYLAEPEIVALLLTGRTIANLQGAELDVAREQFANYLSGRFGNVFQSAGSAFGLNTVRVEPVLLAGDEDLSARLTVGKDITRNFNLVYSQNLAGPRAQTWIASYQAIRDLLIRGTNRSDDNNLTVELRHDLKWGGGPPLPVAATPQAEGKVGVITFEGTAVPEKELLKQVTGTGKPFMTYRMNEDVRRLQAFLADRGFLNVRVRAVKTPHDGSVDLRFIVEEGPSITFAFEGLRVSKDIQEEIRQIWIRGVAEASSLRQSQDRLLRYLRDEGYLQAAVSSGDESPDPEHRRFVFKISPGRKFPSPGWVFKGIDPIDLEITAGTVLEDPKAVKDRIESALWTDGYLNASCTEPALVIDGNQARFEIAVERGPRYSIGRIASSDEGILSILPPGEEGGGPGTGMFSSAWLDRARQVVIERYWENGFNDVQVTAETMVPESGTAVNVEFKIDEGERQIVDRIEIEGQRTTNLDYILQRFAFEAGDPVDHSRINLTRKSLYDTGLFRRVDLDIIKEDEVYIARTRLNEKPPWNFRYGFAVTDQLQTSDREFGATADFSYSNLLGRGITTGTSFKYTRDTRDTRVFGSLPVVFGRNATTSAALFRTRDLTIPESVTDLWGVTVQQQWRLRDRYLLSYDYSYKRNRTYDRNADPDDPFAFDLTIPIARFNGTLTRDTRNDILNATQGTFLSNSFEIAPPGVGSSIQFIRNFAQFFRFRPIGKRVTWASALRAGVAMGFRGQDLIPTERFRAGGGTTLRGFQQDRLGAPGESLFIVNQELRFPLFWRFSGVGFLDAGNVYPLVNDFNPWKLRYSPGLGVRIQTPLVLIRFDVGFNPIQRSGEPRHRFAFGVGQAF